MESKIYKYPLKVVDRQVVEIPRGSTVMCAHVQDGVICLWAEVPQPCDIFPERPLEGLLITIVGTGHSVPAFNKYIGTVQLGGFVWHIYC